MCSVCNPMIVACFLPVLLILPKIKVACFPCSDAILVPVLYREILFCLFYLPCAVHSLGLQRPDCTSEMVKWCSDRIISLPPKPYSHLLHSVCARARTHFPFPIWTLRIRTQVLTLVPQTLLHTKPPHQPSFIFLLAFPRFPLPYFH